MPNALHLSVASRSTRIADVKDPANTLRGTRDAVENRDRR
jgi:hypothetical protein